MKPILFLDFDGVLNSSKFMLECFDKGIDPDDRIDPIAVKRLNRITDETGAVIVVSSTWRLYMNNERLAKLFFEHGITGTFFGSTPELREGRGSEIHYFVMKYNLTHEDSIESFVVLDDNSVDKMNKFWIKTEFETGLLDEHVEKAIAMLNS